jgi:hypothetical protein
MHLLHPDACEHNLMHEMLRGEDLQSLSEMHRSKGYALLSGRRRLRAQRRIIRPGSSGLTMDGRIGSEIDRFEQEREARGWMSGGPIEPQVPISEYPVIGRTISVKIYSTS